MSAHYSEIWLVFTNQLLQQDQQVIIEFLLQRITFTTKSKASSKRTIDTQHVQSLFLLFISV